MTQDPFQPLPFVAPVELYRFRVAQYQRLIEIGILTERDACELLEGYLVLRFPEGAMHRSAMRRLAAVLHRLMPASWVLSTRCPVTLSASEPEPDFSAARGRFADYDRRHPPAESLGLVVEVADASLVRDRTDKARIYARESIPVYWVVNVVDRQIEVYTDPTGPGAAPVYRRRQDFPPGTTVPIELDGRVLGGVAVDDVFGGRDTAGHSDG